AILAADESLQRLRPEQVTIAKRELGHLSWEEGKYADALRLYTEVEDAMRKLHGPDNPEVLQTRFNQAAQHYGMKAYPQAEAVLVALRAHLERLEPTEWIVHQRRSAAELLASVYRDSQQFAREEAVLRERLAAERSGPASPPAALRTVRGQLAVCL